MRYRVVVQMGRRLVEHAARVFIAGGKHASRVPDARCCGHVLQTSSQLYTGVLSKAKNADAVPTGYATCAIPQSAAWLLTRNPLFATSRVDALLGVRQMPDKFDPYREALIMEIATAWPEEYDELEPEEKTQVEAALHADPESCTNLEYIRTHTGFCRQITVTNEDFERVQNA